MTVVTPRDGDRDSLLSGDPHGGGAYVQPTPTQSVRMIMGATFHYLNMSTGCGYGVLCVHVHTYDVLCTKRALCLILMIITLHSGQWGVMIMSMEDREYRGVTILKIINGC